MFLPIPAYFFSRSLCLYNLKKKIITNAFRFGGQPFFIWPFIQISTNLHVSFKISTLNCNFISFRNGFTSNFFEFTLNFAYSNDSISLLVQCFGVDFKSCETKDTKNTFNEIPTVLVWARLIAIYIAKSIISTCKSAKTVRDTLSDQSLGLMEWIGYVQHLNFSCGHWFFAVKCIEIHPKCHFNVSCVYKRRFRNL